MTNMATSAGFVTHLTAWPSQGGSTLCGITCLTAPGFVLPAALNKPPPNWFSVTVFSLKPGEEKLVNSEEEKGPQKGAQQLQQTRDHT